MTASGIVINITIFDRDSLKTIAKVAWLPKLLVIKGLCLSAPALQCLQACKIAKSLKRKLFLFQ